MSDKKLSPEEVSMIRGVMRYYPEIKIQEIQSWFSVPGRSVNSGRFSEIKNGHPRYADIPPCAKALADEFVLGARNVPVLMQLTRQLHLPGMDGMEEPRRKKYFDGALDVEVGASMARALTPESASVEFKVSYEKSSIGVYIKTLSGMLNSSNPGGIFFGVSDNGTIIGVSGHVAEDLFHRKIRAFFDPFYEVGIKQEQVGGKELFYVKTTTLPDIPVICRKTKTTGDRVILEDGAIYYRYGSNTDKIKYAELRRIIDAEVRQRLSLLR